MSSFISMAHLAHPYSITDHSSLLLKLDFTQTEQGAGTFRCPPGIQSDPIYPSLAANSIKITIINAMAESDNSRILLSLLETRIQLKEELHVIDSLIPFCDTSTRVKTLTNTIAILLSNEPSNEELKTENFVVNKPNLLEMVLTNLKNDTKNFTARAKVKLDTFFATLQAEIQSLISGERPLKTKLA